MLELDVFTTTNHSLGKIKVQPTATVKNVKIEIAKLSTKLYVDRQSIRTEIRGKDQNDELTVSSLNLVNGSKVFVKDLGPQISWRTVFILEYLGPLLAYLYVARRPWIFYGESTGDFTFTAYLALICWSIHYAKRVLETIFVHRFSHGTMPIRNLYKNCGYYWGFALYVAYHTNHPLFTPPNPIATIVGFIIFIVCEYGNYSIHVLLRDLRPPGTKVRKIPTPNSNPLTTLFNYVSCPNYTYEFGSWVGFTIMTSCLPAAIFAAAGMYQMTLWAIGKHRNYKKEFKDYPKKRKAIIPFVL